MYHGDAFPPLKNPSLVAFLDVYQAITNRNIKYAIRLMEITIGDIICKLTNNNVRLIDKDKSKKYPLLTYNLLLIPTFALCNFRLN